MTTAQGKSDERFLDYLEPNQDRSIVLYQEAIAQFELELAKAISIRWLAGHQET